ncbi:hypothetical protein DFR70_108339 [Nocardia tenerifensis]|uniref:Uncharacterized protein n=1 Tax=Nocardia tenerifensis TaxID=228006 RepID=A0A318K1D2_9NOCA|nr:hypothetical protein [Nocardia tenerifensis]PXX61781.1 hypothetical protein DFR70_108339 [Nocardia tenerifensis]
MRSTDTGWGSDKSMFIGFFLVITGTAAAGLFLVAAGLALPVRAVIAGVATLALLTGGTIVLLRVRRRRGGLLDPEPTREEVDDYREDYRR